MVTEDRTAAATGMLARDELIDLIDRKEIETVLAVFPDMYGRLMGKRITGHFFRDHVADGGMHACDYLLTVDMEMDPVPGYAFASWERGYGDVHLVPDFSTARRAAWLPRTALVICDLLTGSGDEPVEVSPRRILQQQVQRARDAGFEVMAGSEIELYCFEDTYEAALDKRFHGLQPMGRYYEDYHILQGTKEESLIGSIRSALDASGVPVEFSKGEWGPGQQEINLEYSDVLVQSDRNVVYKHAAKEIAHFQGRSVTFMAKWDEALAGSSMHVHVSLRDRESGRPSFPGAQQLGPIAASDTFRYFLGGWMRHAADLTPFFAPSVNSYKRFQEGSFAPTGLAWSYDNRTAGFRIVGHGPSLRIECRIPGADANPYLVYAASIAAGLDGLAQRIEPPPIFEGDIYQAADLPRVPRTLRDGIEGLRRSELARAALGDEVVTHYLHFLETEQTKFDGVVTDWERARFFERA
ncbi:MAG TPA: glutamine synthetase family protein [Chloroflexota bacterium]|nr:glutamine synthetase family protein [Chloroflexota bacterium]